VKLDGYGAAGGLEKEEEEEEERGDSDAVARGDARA
jgi:hypothetical protein